MTRTTTRAHVEIGQRFGERTVIAFAGIDRRYGQQAAYLVRCDCGNESILRYNQLARSKICLACQRNRARRIGRSEVTEALEEAAQAWPQLWRGDSPESIEACAELAASVGGLMLREIGALLGVSKQRAEQIESVAIEKLRRSGKLKELAGADQERTHLWDEIESHAIGGDL